MGKINAGAIGMGALYLFESVHPDTGKRTPLSGWSPNTVLTSGLYAMSQQATWLSGLQVGTDNTTPDASQTGLLGYVAGTSTVEENVTGAQSAAPYYAWRRKRFRFPIGSVSGNLAEVGVGWGTTNASNLVSRALIVDINGDVTTVTPKIDEYLDVTVEFRYYPPTVDATGTVDFNSVTYNYIVRAMNVTGVTEWASGIGNKIESFANTNDDWLAYDNDIGATIEDGPSGLTANSDNDDDYTSAPAGTAAVSVGMNVGPGTDDVDGWSLTTGKLFRSLRVQTTAGWYQVQFDNGGNGVPKTDQFTMQVQFNLSWGEATIP